jgi:Mannosyltransferase putative
MPEDFGIIIACCARDYIFAKGCCASIRHSMGDIPIALIVDGNFSTKSLEDAYQVRVINQHNIASDFLRKKSFGFGLTKMIAFWESPWQHFLYLDSDTIAWGNILNFANYGQFDVISDQPAYESTDQDISTYYFDVERIGNHFPDFDWTKHRKDFFCTGVFFGTRGIFSIEDYRRILDICMQDPRVFKMGEQGFLNLMLFQAADQGKIRIGQAPLQFLVPDFSSDAAQKMFPLDAQTGPIHQGRDIIIHWCGVNKPISTTSMVYARPMTFYRHHFLSISSKSTGKMAGFSLKIEDLFHYVHLYKGKFRRKIAKLNQAIHRRSVRG